MADKITITLGTSNPHKVFEINKIAKPFDIEFLPLKSENFNPIFKPKLISDTNFYALPVSLSTFLNHAATLREGILFSLNCQLPDEVEGTFILVELSKSSTS